jgi:CHAD domain-containing protein
VRRSASRGEAAALRCRRVLRSQIGRAQRLVAADAGLSDETVHEFRKELKKARATARLLRHAIDDLSYRLLNAGLQHAAKPLAPLRDARVLRAGLDKLLAQKMPEDIDPSLRRLARRLSVERSRIRRRMLREPGEARQARALLAEARARATRLDLLQPDLAALVEGIRRVYRSARHAFRAARSDASVEALHEWRKQAKYLMNQIDVLYGDRDRRVAALRHQMHELAERLGEDHDLALLNERIDAEALPDLALEPRAALRALIERQREPLQQEAFAIGRRAFRRKPKAFAQWLTQKAAPAAERGA